MSKKRSQFAVSADLNNATYYMYYQRLLELAISVFKWENLPDTVDERYLELTLFTQGQAVFFKDEVMGYLALKCMINGPLNVYHIPINRRAYADNGYQMPLTIDNSTIIYDNMLHEPQTRFIRDFARRLYNLDRIIDVNSNAQKTPIIVSCDENEKLSMLNLYKEYDGNQPFIFGDRRLNPKSLQVLNTQAPYVADKLYQLKTQIWNEALTFIGISNLNIQKKERLVSDEVARSMGGTIASRWSRIESRRQAAKIINQREGLNINPIFRSMDEIGELNDTMPNFSDIETDGENE